MNTAVACLLVTLGALTSIQGTPERSVAVNERFAGSSTTDYAVLRTEVDNLGNHYSYREKTWLDEFKKDPSSHESSSSILLLDVTYNLDVNHEDPNTPPAIQENIHSQDTKLPWAEVLQRYPVQTPARWSEVEMADISTHPAVGIRFKQDVLLLGSDDINKAFGNELATLEWTLREIMGDANSLFLRVSKTGHNGEEHFRVFCIPEKTTKDVRDRAILKPFYLVAGTYETHDEAILRARALLAITRQKKFYGFHPEVWSARQPTGKIAHVVVDEYSMELLEFGRLQQVEKALEINLVPISSKGFRTRTIVR